MVSLRSSGLGYGCLVVIIGALILITTAEAANPLYTNRAARRMSKGCALWGQACLGGHFKKRGKEYPASSEQSTDGELSQDALLAALSRSSFAGSAELDDAVVPNPFLSTEADRLSQRGNGPSDGGPAYPWLGSKALFGGWRPRVMDAGNRL